MRPLDGIRVLELSEGIAGPFCTKLLAEYGAEVIKIEGPDGGDKARQCGPFPGGAPHPEKSSLFFYLNTGKKGITLNLDSTTGRAILSQLVQDADAVVESFAPGRAKELGLDFGTLSRDNPRLVATSITPFGLTGPYRDWQATHLTLAATTGWAYSAGNPDREPLAPGAWLLWTQVGVGAAVATMAALLWAEATGHGQHVDIAAMDTLVFLNGYALADYSYTGRARSRAHPTFLNGPVECKDGLMGVNIMTNRNWVSLCHLMGMADMAEDDRLQTRVGWQQHGAEVYARAKPWLEARTREEVFYQGMEAGIPMGFIASAPEAMAFPQHQARGYFQTVAHPDAGQVPVAGLPFRLSESPDLRPGPPPRLGEHTAEVLSRLGYSGADLAQFKKASII